MSRQSGAGSRIRGDERGVSTTLGYSLTLAITAILVTGLLIAGGALVEDQRERIADEELSVTAEQLASGIGDADRLADTLTGGTVRTTVWLPDRIAGGQYTIETTHHPTAASQPTRATIAAESQAVDVAAELSIRTTVPVANRTVVGGPVVITHRDADGDGSRELVVNESRNVGAAEPEPAAMSHEEVVFVDGDTGELSSVAPDGTVTGYGVDAQAIGPKQVDLDDDGIREIPFVDSSNRLRLVDAEGEIQTIANDAAYSPLQSDYATLLAIGEWNGATSVFYLNTTDTVGGEASIYRVGLDGDSEQVTTGGNGIAATAIAGIGDVNDDGDSDLVYVGSSQQIFYLDGGVQDPGQGVGSNNGVGIGAPRVLASGEQSNIPYVDGSNEVKHYPDQTSDELTSGAAKAPVAAVDWIGDDRLEVIYVDASDGSLKYVTLGGSTGTVTDSDGDPITVDTGVGTA